MLCGAYNRVRSRKSLQTLTQRWRRVGTSLFGESRSSKAVHVLGESATKPCVGLLTMYSSANQAHGTPSHGHCFCFSMRQPHRTWTAGQLHKASLHARGRCFARFDLEVLDDHLEAGASSNCLKAQGKGIQRGQRQGIQKGGGSTTAGERGTGGSSVHLFMLSLESSSNP